MKLSAPIYRLKREAKLLSRREKIPLHLALDRVAAQEGYGRWSLLSAELSSSRPAGELYGRMRPGDLLLVGARPGQGKTLISLELAVEAMKHGHRAAFFSLEYTKKDVLEKFRVIGADYAQFATRFDFDGSDRINAAYITRTLATAPRGTLAVVDYLQLLDQKRENPDLEMQVRSLKSLACDRGLVLVFISQIDRSYDPAKKLVPDIRDVRLPNPVDLHHFDKTCFLNGGEVRFAAAN
jgi:replicative DNA helicase